MSSDSKLEEVLMCWDEARDKMTALSDSIDTYKSMVSRLMDKRGVDSVSIGNFKVTRRKGTRTVLNKEEVPASIWHKYSRETCYNSMYLRRI